MAQIRNVMIGTPCYGGLVTQVYLQSIIKLVADVKVLSSPGDAQVGLAVRTHQDSLVTRARNSIVAAFLDEPLLTHLMFIDADTGFDPQQIRRMLDFDQEVVAGVYPVKTIDWNRIAQRAAGHSLSGEQLRTIGLSYVGVTCTGAEREERDGFVTAQYAGTGFMLLRRDAIERMVQAYPEAKYKSAHINEPPSENRYNLFDCAIAPDTGIYLSEDYTFCQRWRQLGGKVWLDLRSQLRHVGTHEFQGTAVVELVRPAAAK